MNLSILVVFNSYYSAQHKIKGIFLRTDLLIFHENKMVKIPAKNLNKKII